MNPLFAQVYALLLLTLISPLATARAQSVAVATKAAGSLSYDISQEVTLSGTVSSVLTTAAKGMINGSHLLVTTPSGEVDVSVGIFGLQGQGALSVATGQQVEVTGVVKTLREKQVFLARTIQVGDRIYAIRNEHGVPVSPQARERATRKTADGEAR
ncbi:MAG: hypothetical protein WA510_01005 [Acidobacteriaceae bacterium]|jgi:hypothetical protein